MDKKIKNLLENLEKENDIKILFAIENGSRSWGMASKDSDYDVRFIYYQPIEKYLSLDKAKDVINIAFDKNYNICETQGSLIDMCGFDIFKYLKLLFASNPTAIEWLNSPIIYYGDNNLSIRNYVNDNFNQEKLVKHYFSIFCRNYNEFIKNDKMVTYKKYLYSMRGLLNSIYTYNFDKIPPLSFIKTIEETKEFLTIDVYKKLIEIIEIKSKGQEKDKIQKINVIDEFFEQELSRQFTKFHHRNFDVKIFDTFLQNCILI